MKRKMIIFTAIVLVMQLCNSLWAITTTAHEAEIVVKGWLKLDPQPLGEALGNEIIRVETYTDESGEPACYIVYLEPSGFVIVSADDLVEPIIGFADEHTYESTPDNPFGTFIAKDLKRRTAAARDSFNPMLLTTQTSITPSQMKWNFLLSLAEASEGEISLLAVDPETITDICVPPLITAIWGQGAACGFDCFNMYTPNNYPCGCVATMLAQVMRLHKYPEEPDDDDPNETDGKKKFLIEWFDNDDNSITETMILRGGDGNGGPYQWDQMPIAPSCNTTSTEREAIGAICYDAGIASNMSYSRWGSGTFMADARRALLDVFKYANAIEGHHDPNDIKNIPSENVEKMMNPNLDAGNPVFLGITDKQEILENHAVLCDGYGYNASTIYHHINFGWDDMPTWARQMWFLLPDVTYGSGYDYEYISSCVYNIFTVEKGEIISGRLYDSMGKIVEGASVTAQIKGGKPNTVVTTISSSSGIYAFKGLNSNTTYTITVEKEGYEFEPVEATTGKSENNSINCGNVWGADIVGDSSSVTIGTGTSSWIYPLCTSYYDARTQVIYLAEEIGKARDINSLSLEVSIVPGQILENWTIRMKHTNLSEYRTNNCLLEANGWTVVYQNNESIQDQGWCKFEFQTPFPYNGTDNLMVDFSFNNDSNSSIGKCRVSTPGGVRTAYATSYNDDGDPLDWQGQVSSKRNVPNVILTFSE